MDSTNPQQPSTLVEQAAFLFGIGGHRYTPAETCDHIFFVHAPNGACYIVDILFAYCTCQGFAVDKTCIHFLAMQYEAAELARCEEYDLIREYAEDDIFGTQPEPESEW